MMAEMDFVYFHVCIQAKYMIQYHIMQNGITNMCQL